MYMYNYIYIGSTIKTNDQQPPRAGPCPTSLSRFWEHFGPKDFGSLAKNAARLGHDKHMYTYTMSMYRDMYIYK